MVSTDETSGILEAKRNEKDSDDMGALK